MRTNQPLGTPLMLYPDWVRRRKRLGRIRHGALALLWLLVGAMLVLTFGCATTGPINVAVRTGQEQATWIIWHEAYGRTDRPPLVRWVEGKALSCTDPDSGRPGFPVPKVKLDPGPVPDVGGECREGFTWSPLEVLVAWRGDEKSFSETTLAHEFLHALKLREGDFHDHHAEPDFYPRIDVANQRVREAGR